MVKHRFLGASVQLLLEAGIAAPIAGSQDSWDDAGQAPSPAVGRSISGCLTHNGHACMLAVVGDTPQQHRMTGAPGHLFRGKVGHTMQVTGLAAKRDPREIILNSNLLDATTGVGRDTTTAPSVHDLLPNCSFARFERNTHCAQIHRGKLIGSSPMPRKRGANLPDLSPGHQRLHNRSHMQYDALLVVSFGGPESNQEVIPFLENVLRGKNVPRERMLAVAEHYYRFGGKSPINQQNRELIDALQAELEQHGPRLPVYWGNRNWHPLLAETLQQMKSDGIRRALAFVTSAYSSYSGCRQYRENIASAQAQVGPGAPEVDKLRVFYNHPGFIEPMVDRVGTALAQLPEDSRERSHTIYTAHSVPLFMAQTCNYVKQLEEACRLVSEALGRSGDRLVFQSRSGPAGQPWLEPDVLDYLREAKQRDLATGVVVAPIGFISDHMEVLYDLDTEAQQLCAELQLPMVRAGTVGAHPKFVRMIRELIVERMSENPIRSALGALGASPDVCPADCCPVPQRPPAAGRP